MPRKYTKHPHTQPRSVEALQGIKPPYAYESVKPQPPAYSQLKNTPYTILVPDDPFHPAQVLRAMMDEAKQAMLAVDDPVAYIREHWDKRFPKMWEVLLKAAIMSGDIAEVRETLSKMTAMSGIAPRSKVDVGLGPLPDVSHLSDEEIAKLRGVVAIEGTTEDDDAD